MRLALCSAFLLALAACDVGPAAVTLPPAQDVPEATLVEVNTTAPVPARYTVTGTVVATDVCPPCPPDALCIPCPPEAVWLGPVGSAAPRVPGDPRYLAVETDLAAGFRVGRTYCVSILVQDGVVSRHVTLIGADRLD